MTTKVYCASRDQEMSVFLGLSSEQALTKKLTPSSRTTGYFYSVRVKHSTTKGKAKLIEKTFEFTLGV